MFEDHVAILGAGAAGLYAARLLMAAAIPFVVIEARDRLGGRILTVDVGGRPTTEGFDLGPSWVWPQAQPALGALIEALGLSLIAQADGGDMMFERAPNEPARRYPSLSQEPASMRIVGGTGALVSALAQSLPAARLWQNARVTAMALAGDGVALTIDHADGRTTALTAGHVIAALPPRLLEATVTFTPAQPPATAQHWRDTPTWMAPHAKCLALYERPFWREAGLSGAAQSRLGPMVEIHDASTATGAALFGFIGIGADDRAAIGEAALSRACLAQLVRLFGPAAGAPQAILFKDWAADELTATAADRAPSGHPVAGDALGVSGPWHERLWLAGSETSPSDPGYIAGAVVAAQRAVTHIIAKRADRGVAPDGSRCA
jgi:monoamine oxidase